MSSTFCFVTQPLPIPEQATIAYLKEDSQGFHVTTITSISQVIQAFKFGHYYLKGKRPSYSEVWNNEVKYGLDLF